MSDPRLAEMELHTETLTVQIVEGKLSSSEEKLSQCLNICKNIKDNFDDIEWCRKTIKEQLQINAEKDQQILDLKRQIEIHNAKQMELEANVTCRNSQLGELKSELDLMKQAAAYTDSEINSMTQKLKDKDEEIASHILNAQCSEEKKEEFKVLAENAAILLESAVVVIKSLDRSLYDEAKSSLQKSATMLKCPELLKINDSATYENYAKSNKDFITRLSKMALKIKTVIEDSN